MTEVMGWTDNRIAVLKKLWIEGLSASEIARELGGGATRNSVIGKVHRLKLATRPSVVQRRDPKPPKPRKERKIVVKKEAPIRNDSYPIPGLVAAPPTSADAWLPLPGSTPVKVEHHRNGCKWPIGDPACFCNNSLKLLKLATETTKAVHHHAYCEAHVAVAAPKLKKAS